MNNLSLIAKINSLNTGVLLEEDSVMEEIATASLWSA